MGLLKLLKDVNEENMDFMVKHPMTTGVYGSQLLDFILKKETEPFYDEGKHCGYTEASHEYEKKLLEQADYFLEQKHNYERVSKEREELIDLLMAEIEKLEAKERLTQEENEYLKELLLREHKLKRNKN